MFRYFLAENHTLKNIAHIIWHDELLKFLNFSHPDKVSHLGKEMQDLAEEKFKAVNDAYQQIKKTQDL